MLSSFEVSIFIINYTYLSNWIAIGFYLLAISLINLIDSCSLSSINIEE